MIGYITPNLQLPSFLIYPRFLLKAELTETAKRVYLILLDRARMSSHNSNYIDKNGHVFIYYPITELALAIEKCEMTVKTALSTLEACSLIQRVRRGTGQANRIYVRIILTDSFSTDNKLSAKQTESYPCDRQNIVCYTDRKLSGNNNINNNNIVITKEQEERTAYGSYKNVFLSDDEYRNLAADFKECDEYIERLSVYMASTGKSYSNHAATVRKWIMQDKPKIQERNYDCREDESL